MHDVVPELDRLGFRIVRRQDEVIIALRKKWYWDCVLTRMTTVIVVRRVDVLDAATIERDRQRLESEAKDLDRGGLPGGFQKGLAVLPMYFARVVDASATKLITTRPKRRWAYLQLPSALDETAGKVILFERSPAWGFVYFPKLRFLARRILDPTSAPAREPLSVVGLLLTIGIILMFSLPLIRLLRS